ncbi:protein draper-like [Ostrea edulis]|uniref:protein draper-like n=1 Tax=Ostrea edulis TaxID=37623 RepID=UPI0024AF8168|nr:protein draper-like [Ostrea edulis]
MYRRWVYMCLIFYLTLETSYSQCYDDKTCECHCNCCSNCLGFYCTSCNREGWSGSTTNQCQRRNIAYNQKTNHISTVTNSINAVDEKHSTYFRTEPEKNPWIEVNLDKIQRVKYIYITLLAGIGRYSVYVKNSSNENLNTRSLCAGIMIKRRQRLDWNITCRNDQVITGDQVVVCRETTRGRLTLFDIKVFQCSKGTYGYLCDKKCVNCLNSKCDGFSGDCIKGCKSGWYGDRCDVECPSDCESGSCDRYKGCTDCHDGYNVTNCEKCTLGTYGKNCSLKCVNCQAGFCNNVNGCKQCWRGFYGPSCNKPCPEGCRNDECDKKFGLCSVGCKDGYKGSDCQQPCDSQCITCDTNDPCIYCVDGRYGQRCERICPETCGGKRSCDRINGQCHECIAGKYGEHCSQSCSKSCFSAGVCKRNGECLSGCINGWLGGKCDKKCLENCSQCTLSTSEIVCERCAEGHYLDSDRKCQSCPSKCLSCDSKSRCTRCKQTFTGNLCGSKCNVNCFDDLCEIDGRCLFGCSNQKYGLGCTTDCRENCVHCYNGNNCTRCLPGYFGIYCTGYCYGNCYNCTSGPYDCEACKPGFYGSYCQNDCSSECLTCDSADSCTSCREGWSGSSCQCNSKCADGCGNNGKCWNGCKGSFYGDYCDTPCPSDSCEKCDQTFGNCTECTKGRYGIHCDMDCSGTCLVSACDIAGGCLRGCVEGFSGTNCADQIIPSKSMSSTTPYVYVVAVLGGLLLVLTITLVTFFVKRKRERERTIRMTYQTVRVACQEADHDYERVTGNECVSREPDYQTIDS